MPTPSLELTDVHVRRDDRSILGSVSVRVDQDQRWIVLGSNGSGKSTLLRIMALYDHPTTGTVDVLGERLGRTDVRVLRRRIGYSAAGLADQLRPEISILDVVMTAKFAALEPWWHRYDDADATQARRCLHRLGVGHLAERTFGTLSSGEQKRVLLARTLMNDPGVVLLDEPSAGLDLGGREQLVGTLGELALDRSSPPVVLVTHHVDEIPAGITHALLLREGDVLAAGTLEETMTAESLSDCFDLPLALERRPNGRFTAWARP